MKKFIFALMFISVIFMTACPYGGFDKTQTLEQNRTSKLLEESYRQIGMPNITRFTQKKTLKMIYELCDREDLVTYAYLFNKMSGKFVFIGKAIGYGIPFSAQYTNPMKLIDDPNGNYDAGSVIVPQADPNGLYMPTSSSATWLLLLDKNNKPRVVYIEQELFVSPFPLDKSLVQNENYKY